MRNFLDITSPLDQFEIRNLLALDAPILGNLSLSITNIGLYLTIAGYLVLMMALGNYIKNYRSEYILRNSEGGPGADLRYIRPQVGVSTTTPTGTRFNIVTNSVFVYDYMDITGARSGVTSLFNYEFAVQTTILVNGVVTTGVLLNINVEHIRFLPVQDYPLLSGPILLKLNRYPSDFTSR